MMGTNDTFRRSLQNMMGTNKIFWFSFALISWGLITNLIFSDDCDINATYGCSLH